MSADTEAFSFFCLAEKSNFKISSVSSSEQNLFVGTHDGEIVVYSLDRKHSSIDAVTEESQPKLVGLTIREERIIKLGKKGKKVHQLEYFPGSARLVSLCSGVLEVWNVHTMQKSGDFPFEDKIDVFAVDSVPVRERICVHSKKSLSLFAFQKSTNSWVMESQHVVGENIEKLVLRDRMVALASKKDYSFFDTAKGSVTELFPYNGSPVVVPMDPLGSSDFLFAQEKLGLTVNTQGVATTGSYQWSSAPLDVVVSPPYVLSLQASAIEVHDHMTLRVAQTIPANDLQHFHKGPRFVFAYSSWTIYALRPYPVMDQVRNFFNRFEIKRGLDLYMTTARNDPDFKENLKQLNEDAGDILFRKGIFEKAFGYYKNSNISMAKLVRFFPSLVPDPDPKMNITLVANREDAQRKKNVKQSTPEDLVRQAKSAFLSFLEFSESKFKNDLNLRTLVQHAQCILTADIQPEEFPKILKKSRGVRFEELEKGLKRLKAYGSLADRKSVV